MVIKQKLSLISYTYIYIHDEVYISSMIYILVLFRGRSTLLHVLIILL